MWLFITSVWRVSVRLDTIFHTPSDISPVKILSYTVELASLWPSDRPHCHFNSRHNHNIYCSQNSVMDPSFDGSNDTINLFSNSVGDISFNDLIVTCTIFAKCCTPAIVTRLSFWGHTVSSSTTPACWVLLPIRKSFKDAFNWLRSLLSWWFTLRVETIFVATTELFKYYEINGSTIFW